MGRIGPNSRPARRRLHLVPAVDRAARVLRALAAEDGAQRLSDLSRRLELSKSTLSELLATLEHHGLVERDAGTRAYRLGLALTELGQAALRRLDVRQVGRPYLVRLRDATGETAVLHMPVDGGAVIVERVESNHDLKVVAPLGHRLPPFAGSVAKVFLAALPEEALARRLREQRLPAFAPNSITEPDEYPADLERVRRRGYAIDDEEYLPGVRAVSAPVFDARGRTAACVTVVGYGARLGRDRMRTAAARVVEAAEQISRKLGATAHPWAHGRGPGPATED